MASAFPPGYLGPTDIFVTSDTGSPLNPADVSALGTTLAKTKGVSMVAAAQYTTDQGQAWSRCC